VRDLQRRLLVAGLAATLATVLLAAGYAVGLVPDQGDTGPSGSSALASGAATTPPGTPSPTPPTPRPAVGKAVSKAPPRPTVTRSTSAPAPQVSKTCTNPVFVTSDRDGGWSTRGYYVHNNMWNSNEELGPETLYACSHDNWYVVSKQTNNAGAVKTYPNVHKDYNDVPISSFSRITSTFAATSPHVGIYNVAFDIWTNGVASSGSTEIMIWTENFNQVPAGDQVATVSLGGRTYKVWKTSDSQYIALVPTSVVTSGSINLLEIFKWLMSKGWLPDNSTVGQIDYGVEIVSTGGRNATFSFTDFSITDN
jgi:hypothetical protein